LNLWGKGPGREGLGGKGMEKYRKGGRRRREGKGRKAENKGETGNFAPP